MPTSYEFVVETLDGEGDDPDILDTVPFDTLAEARGYAIACDDPWRIALRRDRGNEAEGLIERHYAYPGESGRLPERMESATGFQDGPLVPVRFRNVRIPLCL